MEPYGYESAGVVRRNASVPAMIQAALQRGEATLTNTGAVLAVTAPRTGRSPKDKFIVKEAATAGAVDWGSVNVAMAPDQFDALLRRVAGYLSDKDLFVCDAWAGADPRYRMPIRVITEMAWHSLFARQLFRRPARSELDEHSPEFIVVSAPNFHCDPARDGTHSEAVVAVSFERRMVVIAGTRYAGEIKKSIFTALNFLLPDRDVFPMHCSANVGASGDVALFFGLSGTGKTTLSAEPTRRRIGDDEHGWSDRGVFNFEGGCYAKCIRLSAEREPQIYNALRFGAVLENVIIDPETGAPDFDDDAITENTRAAYPIDFIDNAVPEGHVNTHPSSVVFLTCDAFGVLPPISLLTTPQAMYHFLSGYTAKLAGTEAGLGNEPQAAFSACFGAPFLPRSPMVYAELLAKRISQHQARCYLINTGWNGGPYGIGSRIQLPYTRAMVDAALSQQITEANCRQEAAFGLLIPRECPGVPAKVLDPRSTWRDPAAYDAKARELAALFHKNIQSFSGVSDDVAAAGPRLS
ncbi:MAG: phosphoenolpyruvate carboxykinase (ATP) [Phycisphaerae bacterium]